MCPSGQEDSECIIFSHKAVFWYPMFSRHLGRGGQTALFDISKIFKEALSNAPITDSLDIHREKISLTEQKNFIIANFDKKNNLSLDKLIKKLKSKLEIIVTFLALLEMIRTAELVCKQKDAFGQIEMKLNIGAEA